MGTEHNRTGCISVTSRLKSDIIQYIKCPSKISLLVTHSKLFEIITVDQNEVEVSKF